MNKSIRDLFCSCRRIRYTSMEIYLQVSIGKTPVANEQKQGHTHKHMHTCRTCRTPNRRTESGCVLLVVRPGDPSSVLVPSRRCPMLLVASCS